MLQNHNFCRYRNCCSSGRDATAVSSLASCLRPTFPQWFFKNRSQEAHYSFNLHSKREIKILCLHLSDWWHIQTLVGHEIFSLHLSSISLYSEENINKQSLQTHQKYHRWPSNEGNCCGELAPVPSTVIACIFFSILHKAQFPNCPFANLKETAQHPLELSTATFTQWEFLYKL